MPKSRWGKTIKIDIYVYRVADRYVFPVRDHVHRLLDVIELPRACHPTEISAAIQEIHEREVPTWIDDYSPFLARARELPYFADICETSGPSAGRLRNSGGLSSPRLEVWFFGGRSLSLKVVRDHVHLYREKCPKEATHEQLGVAVLRAFQQAENLPETRFPWYSGTHVFRWKDQYIVARLSRWERHLVLNRFCAVPQSTDDVALGSEILTALKNCDPEDESKLPVEKRSTPVRKLGAQLDSLLSKAAFVDLKFDGAEDLHKLSVTISSPADKQHPIRRSLPVGIEAATLGRAVRGFFESIGGGEEAAETPPVPLGNLCGRGGYRALIIQGGPATAQKRVVDALRKLKAIEWSERTKEPAQDVLAVRLKIKALETVDRLKQVLQRASSRHRVSIVLAAATRSTDAFIFGCFRNGRVVRFLQYGVNEEGYWEQASGRAQPWEVAALSGRKGQRRPVRIKAGASAPIVTDAMHAAEVAIRYTFDRL